MSETREFICKDCGTRVFARQSEHMPQDTATQAKRIVETDAAWRACEIDTPEQKEAYTQFAMACNIDAATVAQGYLDLLSEIEKLRTFLNRRDK